MLMAAVPAPAAEPAPTFRTALRFWALLGCLGAYAGRLHAPLALPAPESVPLAPTVTAPVPPDTRMFSRDRTIASHIENWTHVQRAYRGMGIPGTSRAVTCKDLAQCCGVFGKMFKGYGTVLDETDRFTIPTQAHHDVQARFAYFPECFLRSLIRHFHDATVLSQITHEAHQVVQALDQACVLFTAEFNQKDGLGRRPIWIN